MREGAMLEKSRIGIKEHGVRGHMRGTRCQGYNAPRYRLVALPPINRNQFFGGNALGFFRWPLVPGVCGASLRLDTAC